MNKRFAFASIAALALVGLFIHFRGQRADSSAQPEPRREARVSASVAGTNQSHSVVPTQKTAVGTSSHRILSLVQRPDYADALEAISSAPARKIHYARLNRPLLEGKRSPLWMPSGVGKLELPLPDGTVVQATIDRSVMHDASRFSSFATVDGQPGSRVVLSGNDGGQYAATILGLAVGEGPNRRIADFALRPTGMGELQYFEVDETLSGRCGGQIKPQINAELLQRVAAKKAAALQSGADSSMTVLSERPVSADATTSPFVDVMILYTEGTLNKAFGTEAQKLSAIQATFDLGISVMNSDLTRSAIGVQVRLVKVARVGYGEFASPGADVHTDALTALFGSTDGQMDEIHALRDENGADLVCLVIGRNSTSTEGTTIGLAYMMNVPAIESTNDSVGNDFFGLSVVSYDSIASDNVIAHELGHNFGCNHDHENSKNSTGVVEPGVYSYSHGHRFIGKDGVQYRTIMSYQPGTRLHYYSNPRVTASEQGVDTAVGIAAGQTGEADNALTIQKTSFEVASFRLQKASAINSGRLLGLATRSYVGTGEQQLIAGIVVNGTISKRVLLRASGPGMSSISNFLRDPKLSVYNVTTGALISRNSSWALHESSSQVNAAGFAPSSPNEAAMILTLPGGAYSANVESDDAGTGIGMIEAYELNQDAEAKLLGIASRGYADTKENKQMIAGIAVTGTPGQTKRLVVRVQGPTMGRDMGIQTPMYDPYLELHASDGTLLFANDDWATGATLVNGSRDDFQPTNTLSVNGVTYTMYSGSEIAKTGLAPANRREPALLVDLLPGNYTVVIQPFERLSSIPDENQPARPGVGMVEVYEINASGKVN